MKHQRNKNKIDLQRLKGMSIAALRDLCRDRFGDEHIASNPVLLQRRLAWHLQADEQGTLPQTAKERALAIARDVDLRIHAAAHANRKTNASLGSSTTSTVLPRHDSRLPLPGSLLVREFKGRTLVVHVLEDGFEYEGRRYGSLSSVAREITGTRWNGFAFFGLMKESGNER